VVTDVPGAVSAAELIELVTETLNEMWAPATVEFLDRLPQNRSAKVDKQALRARWAQARAASAGAVSQQPVASG
ncbi:MAG: AMP-dependent synthetase, partial [Jatrophihabitantaceae bacterium]